jgi:zinc D-Ala-D-Ala carboxypeptidase
MFFEKIGTGQVQLTREQPNFGFNVDSDLLRESPHIVKRKLDIETIKSLNSINDYSTYGVIMEIVETKNPQTNINKVIKQNTFSTNDLFIEYVVLPVEKAHGSLEGLLKTKLDILKSISLVRCSTKIKEKIPPGSFVEFSFTNSAKEDGSITYVHGQLPPIIVENLKPSNAKEPFNASACSDKANIKSNSDAINPTNTDAVDQTKQPTPSFSVQGCETLEEELSKYNSGNGEKISKYFTLQDLTKSATAKRLGIDNTPDEEETKYLTLLANKLLDILVDKYGQNSFYLTNAFRNEELNSAVNGSGTSQHRLGQAADVKFSNLSDQQLFDRFDEIIKSSDLPIDQLIFESNGPGSFWFHMSIAPAGRKPRREVLSMGAWNAGSGSKYAIYDRNKINLYLEARDIKLTEMV